MNTTQDKQAPWMAGTDGALRLPALGRTLSLGALWNGRDYSQMAGMSLWDSREVEKHQRVTKQPSSQFHVETNESERRKTHQLSAEGSVALSVGLFAVEGAATYLREEATSEHEVFVTVTCVFETQQRQIPQEQLAALGYAKNLDVEDATHFVAAVEEGGTATMMFKARASSRDEKTAIVGKLRAEIGNFLGVSIGAGASISNHETALDIARSIECRFEGDYALAKGVLSFEEALEEAKRMPKQLQDATKTLRATLLPLRLVDSKAIRICRAVSARIVDRAARAVEALDQAQTDVALLKESVVQHKTYSSLDGLREQVTNFETNFCSHVTAFRAEACKVLPLMKGAANEEHDLRLDRMIDLAMHQCKVAAEFTKQKSEELDALDQYVKVLVARGFELQTGQLPIRTIYDGPCMLVNLGALDQTEDVHPLVANLNALPMTGARGGGRRRQHRAQIYKWWTVRDKIAQLEAAVQRKEANDAIVVKLERKPEYWLGYKPCSEGDDGDEDDDLLFVHTGTVWEPWQPPSTPAIATRVVTATEVVLSCDAATSTANHQLLILRNGDPSLVVSGVVSAMPHTVTNLEPNTTYVLELTTLSYCHGASVETSKLQVKTERLPSIARRMKESVERGDQEVGRLRPDGKLVLETRQRFRRFAEAKHCGGKSVVCLECVDVAPGFEPKCRFGVDENAIVMLLCGATGAGKSTHLNAMMNRLFGIELDDDFRILLVDDSTSDVTTSVTQHITIYRVRHFPGMNDVHERSLILVDSPGFADTRGLEADHFTVNAFKVAFGALTHVNCIGLVVKASQERLDPRERYVFNRMLGLFHKTIAPNLVAICTFSDHGDPLILQGLKKDEVPFQHFVKVNNSPFSCKHDEQIAPEKTCDHDAAHRERELYWELAYNGIKSLFSTAQHKCRMLSLASSSEILQKRQDLHETLYAVVSGIQVATSKVAEIKAKLDILVSSLGNVPRDTVAIKTVEQVKKDKPEGTHVTVCLQCNYTCHDNCAFANDSDKARCCAMDPNGNCKMCAGKCHWSEHFNTTYIIECQQVTRFVVPQDIINEWAGRNGTVEKAIFEGLQVVEDAQNHANELLNQAINLQGELQNKSLRQHPKATLAYIDSLIQHNRDRGADESTLRSLRAARNSVSLEAEGCAKQQRGIKARAETLNIIKVELTRRSKKEPKMRVQEEKEPSDFYNKVFDAFPLHLRKLIPPRLERKSSWLGTCKQFPEFKVSLQNTAEALKVLIDQGAT